MTEKWRCHHHDGLHAGVGDHRSVIVVDWNRRAGKQPATASSADGRKSNSGNVVQQMLEIATAMPSDSDEADSEIVWRSVQHYGEHIPRLRGGYC